MEQAINAAQVNERAIVGQTPHHAMPNLSRLQAGFGFLAFRLALLIHSGLVGQNDLAALLVHFNHFERDRLADIFVQIGFQAAVADMRRGHEAPDTQVYHKPALDAIRDQRRQGFAAVFGLLYLVPRLLEVRALFGKHGDAVLIFRLDDVDLDFIADFDNIFGVEIAVARQFIGANDTLGLGAHIYQYAFAAIYAHNRARNHLVFAQLLQGAVVFLAHPQRLHFRFKGVSILIRRAQAALPVACRRRAPVLNGRVGGKRGRGCTGVVGSRGSRRVGCGGGLDRSRFIRHCGSGSSGGRDGRCHSAGLALLMAVTQLHTGDRILSFPEPSRQTYTIHSSRRGPRVR